MKSARPVADGPAFATYEALDLAWRDSLARYARRLVGDVNDAEDLAAEALGRAWCNWHAGACLAARPLAGQEGWLIVTIRHLAIDHNRKIVMRRRKLNGAVLPLHVNGASWSEMEFDVADEDPAVNPEEAALRADAMRAAEEGLPQIAGRCSVEEWRALRLAYGLEMSPNAAVRLVWGDDSLTISACKTRLWRARLHAAGKPEPHYDGKAGQRQQQRPRQREVA